MLEKRAEEAEKKVCDLEVEMRLLKQQLQEEKNKCIRLEAQLEYHGLGLDLPDDAVNEVNVIVKYKQQVEELKQELEKKNAEIVDLYQQEEEHHQRNYSKQMELIEVRHRAMAELEYEAVNNIKEALLNIR